MTNTSAGLLANVTAFRTLDDHSLNDIAPMFATRIVKRNQTVIAHNDTSTEVYFVLSGLLRATIFSPAGREISYQDLHPGEMFGELAAIDQLPRSTHVIAVADTSLAVISRNCFVSLVSDYPQIALATLHKLAQVVRFLSDRVYEFGALDVNHRIRAELVRLAVASLQSQGSVVLSPGPAKQRITIKNMPTHQELANQLATHREAVSRELSSLEKAGLIEKHKHMLVITDFEKLRAMVWE
jgi:CRP-like cAMP-binding protein